MSPPDVLPSWNEGNTKRSIVEFVRRVTAHSGPDFVAPSQRIAVFDNDGCLWAEQPMYFQLAFAIDRLKALAPAHPEWKTRPPFDAFLRGDKRALAAEGERGAIELLMAAHAGNTTEEFARIVTEWTATAKHPTTNRPYVEMAYKPMVEVLAYLRANGFKTYIVSGGGVEFMRPWVERVYGIPPEQVVGSRIKVERMPLATNRIHPDRDRHRPFVRNGLDRRIARGLLVFRLHRIFEIEHHQIGAESAGFGDRSVVRRGQEQH